LRVCLSKLGKNDRIGRQGLSRACPSKLGKNDGIDRHEKGHELAPVPSRSQPTAAH